MKDGNLTAMLELMLDLVPDLPDDTPIEIIRIPTRIRNAAAYAGLNTIGEVRAASDEDLLSIPDLGHGSVKWLRDRLGPKLFAVL